MEREPDGGRSRFVPFKPGTISVLLSLPLLILFASAWHWEFGVVVALLGLPPVVALYMWWRPNQTACSLAHVIVAYGRGFWVLGSAATLLGFIAFYSGQVLASMLVVSLFGWLPALWQVSAVLAAGLCCFVAAEEMCKLVFARWSLRRRLEKIAAAAASGARGGSAAKPFVIGAASASLGHASALSIILSLLVTQSFLSDERIDGGELETILFWAFVFAVASMPLNVLCAYLIALELQRLPTHVVLGLRAQLEQQRLAGAQAGTAGPAPAPPQSLQEAASAAQGMRPAQSEAELQRQRQSEQAVLQPLWWPVGMRSLFSAQPLFWLTLFAGEGRWGTAAVVLCSLLSACALYYAVLKKVKQLEAAMPAASAHGSRRRFGFALLAADDDDDEQRGAATGAPPANCSGGSGSGSSYRPHAAAPDAQHGGALPVAYEADGVRAIPLAAATCAEVGEAGLEQPPPEYSAGPRQAAAAAGGVASLEMVELASAPATEALGSAPTDPWSAALPTSEQAAAAAPAVPSGEPPRP